MSIIRFVLNIIFFLVALILPFVIGWHLLQLCTADECLLLVMASFALAPFAFLIWLAVLSAFFVNQAMRKQKPESSKLSNSIVARATEQVKNS